MEGARSILCTQGWRGFRRDNGEMIEAKMTALSYSAAGPSAARSSHAWLRHDGADSHPSREMNAQTVAGYGYAPPELVGEMGRAGGAAIPGTGNKIVRFGSDLKSLIQEEEEEFSLHRSIRSGHQCTFNSVHDCSPERKLGLIFLYFPLSGVKNP